MEKIISKINKLLGKFGYTVIPVELYEKIKNEVASLSDAINVYEKQQ